MLEEQRHALEALEDELTRQKVEGPHDEPDPAQATTYKHPGYLAVLCRSCGAPFIRGLRAEDVTRGRAGCAPVESPVVAQDAYVDWGDC